MYHWVCTGEERGLDTEYCGVTYFASEKLFFHTCISVF